MRMGHRSRSRAAAVLSLALILGLPELRWCQLDWAEVAECLAACPTPVACSATACEAAGAGTVLPCGAPASRGGAAACDMSRPPGAPAGRADDCGGGCAAPRRASREGTGSRGRAWCPAAPRSGTLPHGPDLDLPLQALAGPVPSAPGMEPRPGAWKGHSAEAVAFPAERSAH